MGSSHSQRESIGLFWSQEMAKFKDLFPKITNTALADSDFTILPHFIQTYYIQLLTHKVQEGRKIRAEMLVLAYNFYSQDFSGENIHLAYILGWIVEILHSAQLIGSGRTDMSECRVRETSTCGNDVLKLSSVNDMIFLKNIAFILAKSYFRNTIYYTDLMELLHAAAFPTPVEEGMDLMAKSLAENYISSKFSLNCYETFAQQKSYNSFYLPIALGMIISGVKNESAFLTVKRLTLKIGAYVQAQDDFLDVFGMPEQTGGGGTHIAQGKYSWTIVAALERASNLHRKMLMENYGHGDTFKICVVKTIFERLQLEKLYWSYEYKCRQKITLEIEALPEGIPKPLFQLIMASFLARWP